MTTTMKEMDKVVRLAKEKQYGITTVFRYEHPDLVREGIVFEASR